VLKRIVPQMFDFESVQNRTDMFVISARTPRNIANVVELSARIRTQHQATTDFQGTDCNKRSDRVHRRGARLPMKIDGIAVATRNGRYLVTLTSQRQFSQAPRKLLLKPRRWLPHIPRRGCLSNLADSTNRRACL
jgi:hypothetical protein